MGTFSTGASILKGFCVELGILLMTQHFFVTGLASLQCQWLCLARSLRHSIALIAFLVRGRARWFLSRGRWKRIWTKSEESYGVSFYHRQSNWLLRELSLFHCESDGLCDLLCKFWHVSGDMLEPGRSLGAGPTLVGTSCQFSWPSMYLWFGSKTWRS